MDEVDAASARTQEHLTAIVRALHAVDGRDIRRVGSRFDAIYREGYDYGYGRAERGADNEHHVRVGCLRVFGVPVTYEMNLTRSERDAKHPYTRTERVTSRDFPGGRAALRAIYDVLRSKHEEGERSIAAEKRERTIGDTRRELANLPQDYSAEAAA